MNGFIFLAIVSYHAYIRVKFKLFLMFVLYPTLSHRCHLTVVDGRAQLIAENPKPAPGPKPSGADSHAKEIERLGKELQFAEGAVSPERSCELVCEYLKQQSNEPLLNQLEDTSPWNRPNESTQSCCTLS